MNAVSNAPLTRPEIYEVVIPQFFMDHRKKEYRAMIDELSFTEGRLYPNQRTIKRAKTLNDTTLLSAKPWPQQQPKY